MVPPAPSTAGVAKVAIHIVVPPKKASTSRKPEYISVNTQSAKFAISTIVSGIVTPYATTTINLTPSSSGCAQSTSGTSCTATIAAPVGTDQLAVTTFDQMNGSGDQLSTHTGMINVAEGAPNTASFSLNGIIAALQISVPGGPYYHGITYTDVPLNVTALDASGAVIVGSDNYASPIIFRRMTRPEQFPI